MNNSILKDHFNKYSEKRTKFKQRGRYYHNLLEIFLSYLISLKQSVLEVGCFTGHTLADLDPSVGTGIDLSDAMIKQAIATYPCLEFYQQDANKLT